MKTTSRWHKKSNPPVGDVYNGTIAIREINKNYDLDKKLKLKTKKIS